MKQSGLSKINVLYDVFEGNSVLKLSKSKWFT